MIKVTAVFEYCIGCEVHNDLAVVIRQLTVLRTHTDPYHPFSLFTKWQWFIWKTKDRLGVFVLCWWHCSLTTGLPTGPDLKDEAHLQ